MPAMSEKIIFMNGFFLVNQVLSQSDVKINPLHKGFAKEVGVYE